MLASATIYTVTGRGSAFFWKGSKISDYLTARISSPLWHKAVRLYGVHLLEQEGAEAWWIAFERFAELSDGGVAIQDLLLEALVFAANPLTHFAALWDHLSRDGGQLLRRCLGRFLSVATRPNPIASGHGNY